MSDATTPNPFVQAALDLLMDYDEDGRCNLSQLTALLAVPEPLLSPFNRECAAREALRREACAVESRGRGRVDDCFDANEVTA